MGDILSQVQRWRLNAEELRARAESLSNMVAKDEMLDMAERYDRLADRMEELAAKELARKQPQSHRRER